MRLQPILALLLLVALAAHTAIASSVEDASELELERAEPGTHRYVHRLSESRYVHNTGGSSYRHKRTRGFKTNLYVHALPRQLYRHARDPVNGKAQYRHKREFAPVAAKKAVPAVAPPPAAVNANNQLNVNGQANANGQLPAKPNANANPNANALKATPKAAPKRKRITEDLHATWERVRRANLRAKRPINAGIPAPFNTATNLRVGFKEQEVKGLTKILPTHKSGVRKMFVHMWGSPNLSAKKLKGNLKQLEQFRKKDNRRARKLIGKLNACIDEETDTGRAKCFRKMKKGLKLWKSKWAK